MTLLKNSLVNNIGEEKDLTTFAIEPVVGSWVVQLPDIQASGLAYEENSTQSFMRHNVYYIDALQRDWYMCIEYSEFVGDFV